ncbi:MAG: YlzJ-like family protein [Clostridiales bacterium]|nr:YlzJ-like family protein [Clostridiales bacterium]
MLHTIESMEAVFFQQENAAPQARWEKSDHGYVQVRDGMVSGVCSTNPADYLKYSIGAPYKS